jgi:hypothetical protein
MLTIYIECLCEINWLKVIECYLMVLEFNEYSSHTIQATVIGCQSDMMILNVIGCQSDMMILNVIES